MHAGVALAGLMDATPTPSPSPAIDPNVVTPGVWGFVAIAFLAGAVILLIFDMMRRIRRGRYRAEVREQLDAEEEAQRQGDQAVGATDVDDQDIDPSTGSGSGRPGSGSGGPGSGSGGPGSGSGGPGSGSGQDPPRR